MIVLLFFLLTILAVGIFNNFYKHRKVKAATSTSLNHPPGSFGWPFLGETLAILRARWDGTPERFITERIERYGSQLVFKTSLMGQPMAVLCGPASNKFLFANENKLVAAWWPTSVRKLSGDCLNTSSGDNAKWMRKMLLSHLGPEAFSRSYTTTMDRVTRLHIQTHWQGKRDVNVFQTVKLHTFELACLLFMSLEDLKHIKKLASLFNIFLKGLLDIPLNFPGTRFYRAMKAATAIRTELRFILKQRRKAMEQRTATSS